MTTKLAPNFTVGDVWEPVTTTTSPKTGAVVKPGSVKLTVTQPNGTVQSQVAMSEEGSGETATWVAQVPLTEAGKWRCDVDTTGTWVGTKPESITVRPR